MTVIFYKAFGHHLGLDKPTQPQLDAGNYPKDKVRFQGLEIAIENPRGSIRRGRDAGGHEWATSMTASYGYLLGTLGVDGDHFDVYVGPDVVAPDVYVITTRCPPDFKRDDEQKAMLGFNSEHEAKAAFLAHYDRPGFFGSMKTMTMADFKREVMTTRAAPRMLKALLFLGRSKPA